VCNEGYLRCSSGRKWLSGPPEGHFPVCGLHPIIFSFPDTKLTNDTGKLSDSMNFFSYVILSGLFFVTGYHANLIIDKEPGGTKCILYPEDARGNHMVISTDLHALESELPPTFNVS
jgi:hypothetical protein